MEARRLPHPRYGGTNDGADWSARPAVARRDPLRGGSSRRGDTVVAIAPRRRPAAAIGHPASGLPCAMGDGYFERRGRRFRPEQVKHASVHALLNITESQHTCSYVRIQHNCIRGLAGMGRGHGL